MGLKRRKEKIVKEERKRREREKETVREREKEKQIWKHDLFRVEV